MTTPVLPPSPFSRRRFLQLGGAAVAGSALPSASAVMPVGKCAFFLVGDTHYFAQKQNPAEMDPDSRLTTSNLIETLNRLPGMEIPKAAGGGKVEAAQGVIHVGDLIDSGDKNGPAEKEMQKTEWKNWEADWGLKGGDGRLKYPVYETWGNHDAPQGKGLVLDEMKRRGSSRTGLSHVSPNGLHYSWDSNGIHFVSLGLIVGQAPVTKRPRRYASLESYDFLVKDLKEKAGGRPTVIIHHVDVARYVAAAKDDAEAGKREWDPEDVHAYYDALKGQKILGCFCGHTHARAILRWSGDSVKTPAGLPFYNVDNGAHYKMQPQGFFYVEATAEGLTVREYTTKDRWQTGQWTPQVWKSPVVVA